MGNTVNVRPVPQNPLAVIDLVAILHEVGFPPGVVNVVTGSTPATGEALIETRDIDMVSFTGSTGVGTRIGEVGGRTMKRMLLELGGKVFRRRRHRARQILWKEQSRIGDNPVELGHVLAAHWQS